MAQAQGQGPNFRLDERRGGRGPAAPYKAKTYTLDEQKEKLKAYLEIPRDLWPLIRAGTHVRYYTREAGGGEKFNSGGFVKQNPYDTEVRGGPEKKRFFRLQNGFVEKARGYAAWIAAYEDVTRVYAKCDASVMAVVQMLGASVASLNENMKSMAAFSKKLGERLEALEARR